MTSKLLIATSLIFFSCNNAAVKKQDNAPLPNNNEIVAEKKEEPRIEIPADTASTDYLIYLINNEKGLNDHWAKKIEALDEFYLLHDPMSHLSIERSWVINESISVIILNHATGTSSDDYLLTVNHKKDIVSNVHISNETDSNEKDSIISIGNWCIRDNGMAIKK